LTLNVNQISETLEKNACGFTGMLEDLS